MATRRQFLKTGLAGGILLGAALALHKPLDRMGKRALVDRFPLETSLRQVIEAVAPVMLAGALPLGEVERQDAIRRASDGVATAVSTLSAASQREIAELFALLTLPATRVIVAGVREPWADVGEAQISEFLHGWRNSSVDLLKSGYMALHDLVFGAWYADPATWAGIGYPGPPSVPRA